MADEAPSLTKIVVAKETAFRKASSSQWKQTEKLMDPFNKKVYQNLNNLVTMTELIEKKEKSLKMIGDSYYVSLIRPTLISKLIIPSNLKLKETSHDIDNKSKNIVKKKADIIIEENTKKQLIRTFTEFIDAFVTAKKNNVAYISEYAELRLVGLMHSATKLIALSKVLPLDKLRDKAYEMIFGSKKALYYCKKMEGFSQVAIFDHEQLISVLISKFKFTILDTLKVIPRVVISTNIDNIFPMTDVAPYESQIELINKIKNNNQFLIYLICMIGSGKTSMISPICKFIEKERESIKAVDDKRKVGVIFSCSVDPVRIQAGYIAYNNDITFGFATRDKGKLIVRNHYNVGRGLTKEEGDDKRVLTIADLASTLELVRENKKRGIEDIVFIDEPTVGADQKDHKITRMVMQIIRDAPGRVILSSATMPRPSQVPEINEMFLRKYPDAKIEEVISYETKIGCQIMNMNGQIIAPHTSCTTSEQLLFQIEKLKENPFLGRIYTPLMLYYLVDKMKTNGVPDLPDLEERFGDFRNLSQMNIQKFAIELLEILAKNDNSLIKAVCSNIDTDTDNEIDNIDDIDASDDSSDESDDDIIIVKKKENTTSNKLEPEKFFFEDSHRFMGGCLIACDDPVDFVLKYGKPIFDLVDKEGGYNKMKEKYDSDVEKYKERISDIEKYGRSLIIDDRDNGNNKNNWKADRDGKTKKKQTAKTNKKRGIQSNSNIDASEKEIAKDEKKMSYSERSIMVEDIKGRLGVVEPNFPFPLELQINTEAYFSKFFPDILSNVDNTLIRPLLSNIPDDLGVSDELVLLLRAGIGVYSNNNTQLTRAYSEYVLDLASEGKLAFLVSDGSINYGANYHIGHVIVFDNLASKHSIGTLFQLWGRAGRVGKSWTAHAYIVGKETEERFMKYMKGEIDRGVSMEAQNLIHAMKKLLVEEDEIIVENKIKKEESFKRKIDAYEKEKKRLELEKILQESRKKEEERQRLQRIEERKKRDQQDWQSNKSKSFSYAKTDTKSPFSGFSRGRGKPINKSSYVPPHLRDKEQS